MSFEIPQAFHNSPLWIALKDHLTERLALLRGKNDAPLSVEETARLRGQIAEIKYILGLESKSRLPPA